MQDKDKNYLFLILVHLLLGVVIFSFPIVSKVYGYLILIVGILVLLKTRNKNDEVLYICAYIVGSEVFLRMTNGNPNHEFAKYSLVFFFLIGYVYSGFSKMSLPYLFFIITLLPGIIIANETLDFGVEFRKKISFNLSGSLCLAIAAMHTFGRKLTVGQVGNLLLLMGLPVISTAVFTQLYAPDLKEVLSGTSSNSELSGGFGPNQVATILGLGMFIFFTRIILYSRTKLIFIVNVLIAFYVSYRGLLTFSRGGMITGFLMILIFLLFIYFKASKKNRVKLNYFVIIFVILVSAIWMFTSVKTEGLIDKRYANKNAMGVEKKDLSTGRNQLVEEEVNWFLDNPFFGIGVGKGTDYRTAKYGFLYASHNEITRLLAEHGMLGVIALMILFFTPIFYYMGNKDNIFLFCFLLFWLLTINHAAMRTAAPSFVYALSVLKIKFDEEEEPVVHRK
ncbi:O-antigen ligase family protein [Flavobacterium sp.]|uniref:O-antigen ligase family protein n=1 Tax=Flavobacterium sp. TaxID=239 RepID=UPI002B4B445E|nr:O-antigen ligase family protein [Flavobacterium sp.]HLP63707.1 O-antigen ligase family protein [Flavobacterium sp.]